MKKWPYLKFIYFRYKNSHHKNSPSSLQIAATYIGTVVGAGFASGQELLQFFACYGLPGLWGIVLSTLLFIGYGYIILKLGMLYHASSYREVIYAAVNKRWLGSLVDIIITFFLFGTFTAMVAGAGSIFAEHFALNALWGNVFMIAITLLTTLMGINGILSAISFVVPVLIIGVFVLAILTFNNSLPINLADIRPLVKQAPISNWFLSAIVYTSYNLVLAIAILAPLGAEVKDKKKLKISSILGGTGLGIIATAILLTLLINLPIVSNYEIPMAYIASRFSLPFHIMYSIILLTEIYTTAVSNLYGFTVRLTDKSSSSYKIVIIITSIFALIGSQFGFSNLVHYLYPIIGYSGLLLIISLTLTLIQHKLK